MRPLTPLGAYYRIDGKSIVDMQSAIFETHAVYVSADVHDGWDRVKKNCKSLAAATDRAAERPGRRRRSRLCTGRLYLGRVHHPEFMGSELGLSWLRSAAL